MYNKDKLLNKTEKLITDIEKNLLDKLIDDVDEFNSDYGNAGVSLAIDFDDVGNDGEYNPYKTFSLKLKKGKYEAVVIDNLKLHELDVACAAIYGYFDELHGLVGLKSIADAYQEKLTKLESEIRRLEDKLILKDIVK